MRAVKDLISMPCDVCGKDNPEPYCEVSLGEVFDRCIYRCKACGFRQIRPRLGMDELVQLYTSDYFDPNATVGYRDYAREAQRRAREAYFFTRKITKRSVPVRILEVGCALGFLLDALRHQGFEVEGVDAAPFSAYYAKTRLNLKIACGTLEDAQFPNEHFNYVIQKDLLEHVPDPRQHLHETARVMKSGGELWLITPNGEANLRPFVSKNRQRTSLDHQLPLLSQGHLSFFSYSHLKILFKHCGFEILRSRCIGVRRGLRALGFLGNQKKFFQRVDRRVSLATNTPSITCETEDDFSLRATEIDAAMKRHHRGLRESLIYYYFHRLGKWADTLPAATELGYDFEFWLKKR